MQTIESMKGKIRSTEDLQSVVKTMKSLAAVNIRQYEKAVYALTNYDQTVEMGLQIVMREKMGAAISPKCARKDLLCAIVFGTDQGMCGPLNEQIASHAIDVMRGLDVEPRNRTIVAVGQRITALLEDACQPVEEEFSVPSSVSAITPMVQEIVMRIETWHIERCVEQVFLFYSKPLPGTVYRPCTVRLLPVDREWLSKLELKTWPSHVIPTFTMDWSNLFSALIREYLFVSLFRAFAESVASESASRLASMQAAEKNIEERLADLNLLFHQQRQMAVTEELMDIMAGFEALEQLR